MPDQTTHPFRGVMLFMLALILFACMDTTTKYLAIRHNVPMVVAMRYIVHCLLMIIFLTPRYGKQLVQTQRTGLVLVRAASLVMASLFVGLALRKMPVAETTAIIFLGPILVVLIAHPMLGERIGALDWLASIAGFCGVLLIAHPSGGLDPIGIIYALGAVVATVVYQLLSRVLVRTEQTIALLFYTALLGSVVFGLLLPWFWENKSLDLKEILLFLSVGITGGLGHFLYTAAYRHASASVLAPINYLQLLWAGLLGWMVFGHVPNQLSILGMCIIAASGAMIALKSSLTVKK